VESHKSYGQKGANAQKSTTNGGPALPRSHIESKVKFYNQFFDNKTNQIRSREVNGRFVLEGALKIYWGVQRVIQLKEDDDQRTVVTVRKRNSIRYRHSAADVMPRVSQRPQYNSYNSEIHRISAHPILEPNSPMTTSTNSNFDADNDTTISESISYDTLSMSSDMNSSPMGSNSSSKEPSPQHAKYPTLPSKLDVKQIEWDEIDDLLQVERKQDDADRVYQTMPSPLPSQSTVSNTEVSDYKTCSVMTGSSCSETLSPLTDNTPESPDKQLLSSATDTNGADDVFATPTNTLKPEDFEDFKKQVREDYINGANNMETYDEGTLKAMQPIDPRRINDSLKIYNDTVMNKSLTEEECFNVLALPKNCKITGECADMFENYVLILISTQISRFFQLETLLRHR
jgi:Ras association domain-containing protein 2/4